MPAAEHPNLVAALCAARAEFGEVVKDKKANAGQIRYSYADLAQVIGAVSEALTRNGLAVLQRCEVHGEGEHAWLGLHTELVHVGGEQRVSVLPLPWYGQVQPQQWGSAYTYARRYALQGILGIAAEDDDDAQAAQHGDRAPKGKPRPAEPKEDADKTYHVVMPTIGGGTRTHETTLPRLMKGLVEMAERDPQRARSILDLNRQLMAGEASSIRDAVLHALGADQQGEAA